MNTANIIEKLLNTKSILNILDNDFIIEFKVQEIEDALAVIMYVNATEEELRGSGKSSPKLSDDELRDKLYRNYNLDPAWWQASIIPNRILKLLVGENYYRNIILFVVDKNGKHIMTEK